MQENLAKVAGFVTLLQIACGVVIVGTTVPHTFIAARGRVAYAAGTNYRNLRNAEGSRHRSQMATSLPVFFG
jgi:hypothetical protein